MNTSAVRSAGEWAAGLNSYASAGAVAKVSCDLAFSHQLATSHRATTIWHSAAASLPRRPLKLRGLVPGHSQICLVGTYNMCVNGRGEGAGRRLAMRPRIRNELLKMR